MLPSCWQTNVRIDPEEDKLLSFLCYKFYRKMTTYKGSPLPNIGKSLSIIVTRRQHMVSFLI
jgi:hypothetical protein